MLACIWTAPAGSGWTEGQQDGPGPACLVPSSPHPHSPLPSTSRCCGTHAALWADGYHFHPLLWRCVSSSGMVIFRQHLVSRLMMPFVSLVLLWPCPRIHRPGQGPPGWPDIGTRLLDSPLVPHTQHGAWYHLGYLTNNF